jgi:hypothetical protein
MKDERPIYLLTVTPRMVSMKFAPCARGSRSGYELSDCVAWKFRKVNSKGE